AEVQAVGEHIAHGDELDVLVGRQRLLGGPGAAAAAADQADAERVAAGSVDVGGGGQVGGEGCRGQGGGRLEERAAGGVGGGGSGSGHRSVSSCKVRGGGTCPAGSMESTAWRAKGKAPL